MLIQEFLWDWFGEVGREVGDPRRRFIDSRSLFPIFFEECRRDVKPCFMSVQPYERRNVVYGLEKLFFDFDSHEEPPCKDGPFKETLILVDRLSENGIKSKEKSFVR